ncbi:LodA/GoxA family CTQ-dependent oxidase [Pseudomonas qingdaonensis]|nr:LodA/GoxA family CTQ-dependent oxidase [Pseudomonas qingdaonensis]
MEEVVRDLFVRQGQLPAEPGCSFTRDIWPIFERMTHMQWTNQGLFMLSGHGSPLDTQNPDVVARLADPGEASADFRRKVFALFRDPPAPPSSPRRCCPCTATITATMTSTPSRHPRSGSRSPADVPGLEPVGARRIRRRLAGRAGAGRLRHARTARAQAQALDRAGLHECLGGPFHPGIELTWFMCAQRVAQPLIAWRYCPRAGGAPGFR